MIMARKQNIPRNLYGKGDANTKLRKNLKYGVETLGLSLSAAKSSGYGNVCPHASLGCESACLDHQGLASVWQNIRQGRTNRTRLYFERREWFKDQLIREIECKIKSLAKQSKRLAVRNNMFSDIPWERISLSMFDLDCEFYDYTKHPKRVGLLLPNYWVTFSRSETNDKTCLRLLSEANNVAVVFADTNSNYCGNRSHLQALPKTWCGYKVIDGDISDLRYQDPRGRSKGRVIGLRLKAHSTKERQGAIASNFAIDW